jgi:hypothetical protein
MSDLWHYAEGETSVGPVPLEQLKNILGHVSNPNDVRVWHSSLVEWKRPGEVNELAATLVRPSPLKALIPPPLSPPAAPLPTPESTSKKMLGTPMPSVGKKLSLWRSANIALFLSAFTLLLQVANGKGFELASYAHTGSAVTISGLIGQILGVPLIFVLVAIILNLSIGGERGRTQTPFWGALTFATLLVGILAALFVYGEVFFSSTEAISGEARKTFIADFQRTCVQKQRSMSQAVTEEQVHSYCTCVSEKMANGTTYKQLGTELDASALADLRQKVEAVGYACR